MPSTPTSYESNLEYLRDELARLDLALRRELLKMRAGRHSKPATEFRGLVILDSEVDEWLKGNQKRDQSAADTDVVTEAIQTATHRIADRVELSIRNGIPVRLPVLAAAFGLASIEIDSILMCLAPVIDLRYQKLFAYLQDDVTKKKPSVDLALRLFCGTDDQRVVALGFFSADGALRRNRLVSLFSDPHERDLPTRAQLLMLDEHITRFLLGEDRLDASWEPYASWAPLEVSFEDMVFSERLRGQLQSLTASYRAARETTQGNWVLQFWGPAGAGKKSAAQAFCREIGLPLLLVNLPALIESEARAADTLGSLLREAQLYGAAAYLDGWHVVAELLKLRFEDPRLVMRSVSFRGLVFVGSEDGTWRPQGALRERIFVQVEFPVPAPSERLRVWQLLTRKAEPSRSLDELPALATTFRFTGGQIVEALRKSFHDAVGRGDSGPDVKDLYASCRAVSSKGLAKMARRIVPKHTWEDLVLEKDSLAQLKELCAQVRHRLTVYDHWGFERKLSLGKGLVALFSGPSGTGKTFASEIIAGDLGMELYQIDLSCVVSKYIGETEKNLSRVFEEAQDSNAILFFDEADALFGKRSEVRDAHDRYANIEINYLLQRVEEYEGVLIMASNLSKNIDNAFMRRLTFSIEFPFPDEGSRLAIWKGIFPDVAPFGNEMDFEFLARKFKIAGGNIKNVAVAAAFRAADNGGVISMEHLALALKREYQN